MFVVEACATEVTDASSASSEDTDIIVVNLFILLSILLVIKRVKHLLYSYILGLIIGDNLPNYWPALICSSFRLVVALEFLTATPIWLSLHVVHKAR